MDEPSRNRPLLLFAPGAGAPSSSRWMVAWRRRLQALGDVVPFDYPYMQAGRRTPDRPPALIAALDDVQSVGRGHARAHRRQIIERAQRIARALDEQDRRAQRQEHLVAQRARVARPQRVAQADQA